MRTRRAGPWPWVIVAYLAGWLGGALFELSERHATQIGALLAGITFIAYVITFAVRLVRSRRRPTVPRPKPDEQPTAKVG